MAKSVSKLQVKTEQNISNRSARLKAWRPSKLLRRGIDQFLEDFELGFLRSSSRRSLFDVERHQKHGRIWDALPAVDIVDRQTTYEITADLPGFVKKNIEVTISNSNLTISGEKQDEKEEKKTDYYLRERLFGSFERSFRIPEDVDRAKIEATFAKGLLTVTLGKKPKAAFKQVRVGTGNSDNNRK
jgi:HSP20 family protein